MDCKVGANIFKVLSDETRLNIVGMLKSGEKCACKLLEKFDITQPTLSYHMKLLVGSGLVSCKKDGLWCYYSLNTDKFTELEKFLKIDNTNVRKDNKCGE